MAKLRVLIADDDPIIRLDLKQMLENLEYEVVAEAGDGQQAVAAARDSKPDICILDVKMPVMDGIEAVSIAPERRRWLSAENSCSNPFWMMIDRPKVTSSGGSKSRPSARFNSTC